MWTPKNPELLARAAFLVSGAFLCFWLGVAVLQYRFFPYRFVHRTLEIAEEVLDPGANDNWYRSAPVSAGPNPRTTGAAADGVNLISALGSDHQLVIQLTSMDGKLINRWDADWFRVWPDSVHLTEKERPKQRPGTDVHGMALLRDGSIVYNYSSLGMVRLDVCGRVLWRLAYRTHHSIEVDEDGVLWVPGELHRDRELPGFPNLKPPFREETLLRVSQDGKILEEISVLSLLKENGLAGLLHLTTSAGLSTAVSGDFLHANDVEPFPRNMTPGAFRPGDVLVSIRNTGTVLVFEHQSHKIKYVTIGHTTRQHDPDFVDGDTIAVFDNNNTGPESAGQNSRIVLFSPLRPEPRVYFQGPPGRRFYTDVLGKEQWLANGDLLLTSARQGWAFELDPHGQIVWEYLNLTKPGEVGLLSELRRLPLEYGKLVLDARTRLCH